jgi:glycosyltransferase involved in cell wall biosynthesis
MKVAYVLMQFPVASETFASNDVKYLKKQGHSISIYCMRPKNSDQEMFKTERGLQGIPISNLSISTIFKFIYFTLRKPFRVYDLLKFAFSKSIANKSEIKNNIVAVIRSVDIFLDLKKLEPDIVHLFWGHYPSLVGYLVLKYMEEPKVTIFLGAHDLVTEYPPSVFVSNRAEAVFTHSQVNVNHIRSMNIDNPNLHVVYRGTPLPTKTFSITEKNDNGDIYATISRLIPEKNVDQVIYTFFEILKKQPDAKLIVMGDGPCLDDLVILVSSLNIIENVMFTGHVSQDMIFSNLMKTKFFLFPSTYRGDRLPNVIKEAMVRGCVCISAKTHGIEELIKDKTGVIFESDFTINALNFINTLSNEEFKLRSHNSRDVIVKYFSLHSSMNKYIEVWKTAIEK